MINGNGMNLVIKILLVTYELPFLTVYLKIKGCFVAGVFDPGRLPASQRPATKPLPTVIG